MLAQKWLQYALLSALCASLVGIFGKVGMAGIDANLATAFRSAIDQTGARPKTATAQR